MTNCNRLLHKALIALNTVPRFKVQDTDSYQIATEIDRYFRGPEVWVLKIDHKHDSNVTVHHTEEQAWAHLYLYIAGQWDEGLSEQYGAIHSLTREEAIEAFYDCHSSALDPECYTLDLCHLSRPVS